MAVSPTLFAIIVWGSIGSVLAAFGYLVRLLVSIRREQSPNSPDSRSH